MSGDAHLPRNLSAAAVETQHRAADAHFGGRGSGTRGLGSIVMKAADLIQTTGVQATGWSGPVVCTREGTSRRPSSSPKKPHSSERSCSYEMAAAVADLRGDLAAKGTYSADPIIYGQQANQDRKTAPPQVPGQGMGLRPDLFYGLGSALPKEPTPQQREQLRRLAPRADLKRMIERLARGGRGNSNRG